MIYSLRYYFGKDLEMEINREEKGVCISFRFPYETSPHESYHSQKA